jgi:cell division protein FtsL
MATGIFGVFGVLYFILVVGMLVLSIYVMILFIKLARRGIKALDIFIDEKNKRSHDVM